jgi:fibro-slime domain-containing protein/uncharacterized repeat protein (TIGR01451 family)/uncharacterized repeat protein (TIGR02543 family)
MKNNQTGKSPIVVSLAVKKVPDLKQEPTVFSFKKALYVFAIAALVVVGLNFPSSGAVRADTDNTLNLPVTIRDFHGVGWDGSDGYSAHPDFEITPIPGDDRGIVQSTLGGDSKPVYAGQSGTPSTYGLTAFNQWYNDTTHVNTSTPYSLTFTKIGNVYQYNNPFFFPIDNQLLGNDGRSHNFHFTLELHSQFAYQTGQTFNFTGDDDVWVFINDKLAIDLGGVHSAESASVNLDTLGLTSGQNYNFDLFFAERHTTESNFKAETNIALDVCGNISGIQTFVPSGMSSDVQGNCGYQVTFDKNGGDTDANPTTELAIANGNTNVGTLPTAPTKTGYTFNSWNTQADGLGVTFDGSTLVTASITVYAKWTITPVGTTIHFVKAVCPAYSNVLGNADQDQKMHPDVSSNISKYENYPNFSSVYSPKPITLADIPASCSKQAGWSFKFSPTEEQITDVGNIGPTGSNGETTISYSQLLKSQKDAITGDGLWVSEDLSTVNKPNDAAFAALRCYKDALNGDNLDYIKLDPNNMPSDVYCIAYNVSPAEQVCDSTTNLVSNGGFEAPVVSGDWDIFPSGTSGLDWSAAWTSADAATYNSQDRPETANVELQKSEEGWTPLEGLQYTELDSDWKGPSDSLDGEPANVSLTQSISTESGANYILSFDYSPRPGHADNQMQVLWNGSPVDATFTADGSANSNTVWTHKQYVVTGTGGSAVLEFKEIGTPDSLGMFLDNVKLVKDCSETPATGSLKVIKHVVNGNGGTAVASDFMITIAPGGTFAGSEDGNTMSSLTPGAYTVSEESKSGYTAGFTGDCNENGNVTVAANQTATCTITNTFTGGGEGNQATADSGIVKTVDNSTPAPGANITYTLVVTNNGNATATSVTATDTLPSTVTYVSNDGGAGYNATTTTVTWTIGDMAPLASSTMHIIVTVKSGATGSISNTATVTSGNDSNPDNNSSTISVTATPPSGGNGDVGSFGSATGGGGGGGGGSFFAVVPQVLGANTGGGLQMPAEGQVLAETTTLPRTGMPIGFTLLIFGAVLALVDKKFKLV